MDGGIGPEDGRACVDAGADALVAGAFAVFSQPDGVEAACRRFRAAAFSPKNQSHRRGGGTPPPLSAGQTISSPFQKGAGYTGALLERWEGSLLGGSRLPGLGEGEGRMGECRPLGGRSPRLWVKGRERGERAGRRPQTTGKGEGLCCRHTKEARKQGREDPAPATAGGGPLLFMTCSPKTAEDFMNLLPPFWG